MRSWTDNDIAKVVCVLKVFSFILSVLDDDDDDFFFSCLFLFPVRRRIRLDSAEVSYVRY